MSKGTLNKVILIGRVGADPEVRYMPNGNAVANIRLATNDGYKDKATGQMQESTEWHRVVSFGKLAEIVGQYVQKGKLLYIEGRIRTNKWQDQAGQDRYTTEIIASDIQFLGGNGSRDESGDASMSAPSQDNAPSNTQVKNNPPADLDKFEDDDIPF